MGSLMRTLCWGFTAAVVAATFAPPAVADYATVVLDDGPVGYWRLDETTGTTAANSVPGGADLEYLLFPEAGFGQPGAIIGENNTAVRFTPTPGADAPLNSISTHSTIAAPLAGDFGITLGESFSFEYWVHLEPDNTSGNGAGLIAKGYDSAQATPWYLSRYLPANGGSVGFYVRDLNSTSVNLMSSTNVDDGQWHHVAAVYDNADAEVRLYVDGVLEVQRGNVPADAYGTNVQPFSIGNHYNRGLDGLVDEVALYASALTGEQIIEHYTAGSGETIDVAPWLKVDLGSSQGTGNGPGGLQDGFLPLEATEADGVEDVTRSLSTLLGLDGMVDVTVGGYTHFRDYPAATGSFASLTDLLSDGMLANAEATITLTLQNLEDGRYELMTYNHTTANGPNARPPATPFDVSLTDGLVTDALVTAGAVMSDNASPELSTQSVLFTVAGGSPVSVSFARGPSDGGGDHFQIAGFEVTPYLKLTWDGQGNGEWGSIDLASGNSRWVDEASQATATYPDLPPDPGALAHVAIGADSVSVVEDRTAMSLQVTQDPGAATRTGLQVGQTLSIERSASFADGTALTLADGATLAADGSIDIGADVALQVGGGATLATGGSLSIGTGSAGSWGEGVSVRAAAEVHVPSIYLGQGGTLSAGGGGRVEQLQLGAGDALLDIGGTLEIDSAIEANEMTAQLIKQGGGTLLLGGGTVDLDQSTLRVEAGTLAASGADPLGGAGSVTLAGGTLSLSGLGGTITGPADPVGYWAFDESAGAAAVNAANPGTNDGLLQNMDDAGWIDGKVGGALDFDGVDDFVQVSQGSGLPIYNSPDGYSVAMWVKGLPQNDMRVFSEGSADNNSPLLNIGTKNDGATGQLDMYIRDDSGGAQVSHRWSVAEPFNGQWNHIAWVEEDGVATVYVNGIADNTDFSYTRSTLTLNTTTIGGILRADPSHHFTGSIDEVYVLDRALDAAEVAAMAGSVPLDMSGTDLVVAADSALSLSSGDAVPFGNLRLESGTLSITGAEVTFAGSSLDPAATQVGIGSAQTLRLGPLDGAGAAAVIAKTGSGDVLLDQPSTNLDNATFNIEGGRLIAAHATGPLGSAGLQLAGGELVLASPEAGQDVAYDNTVVVNASSTLTAGSGGIGAAGPLTVTVGSETNGVALNDGVLTLQLTDDYRLQIAGDVAGPGGMTLKDGEVTLARGGDFGALTVSGGTLDSAGPISVGRIAVSQGAVNLAAGASVDALTVTGGAVNTGGSQVLVAERMHLGEVTFEIDAEHTFTAQGTHLLDGADLVVGGGSLTVSSAAAGIPRGAVGIWTFDDDDVIGDTVVNRGSTGAVADATMFGGFTIEPGHLGNAVSLDGLAGTEIVIPDHDDFEFPAEQSFTISMWYRHFEEDTSNGMITKGYHVEGGQRAASYYLTRIEPGGVANLHSRPTSAGTPSVDFDNPEINLIDDEWHQVTLVRDSEANEIRLYADNISAIHDMGPDDANGDWDMGVNDMPVVIGNHHARYTPGMFDDVLIFNRALDEVEVAALWNDGNGPAGGGGPVETAGTNLTVTADSVLVLESLGDAVIGNLTLEPGVSLQIVGDDALDVNDFSYGQPAAVEGTLLVRGVLAQGLAPADLTVLGDLETDDAATYAVSLAQSPDGLVADLITVDGGDAFIGGSLSLQPSGSLAPQGQAWGVSEAADVVIMQTSGESEIIGEFENVPEPGYLGDGVFLTEVDVEHDFETVMLSIQWLQAAPGDTDGDGDVDNGDLQLILGAGSFNNGTGFGWPQGDFDGDGDVDNGDLQEILGTGLFGTGAYAAEAGGRLNVVPEPATLLLLASGLLTGMLLCRRYRR